VSLNVLVIPEDFRKDQYLLAPIVCKMLAEAGKPRARVRICTDPLLGGVAQALDWQRISQILAMYPVVHLFLLIVDRDGKPGRRKALTGIEKRAEAQLGADRRLFGENAWQELEVWALAGQQHLPKAWKWQSIRKEEHPKEAYFDVLAKRRRLTDEPGAGRTTMGREAAQNYARVRGRCPEDVEVLEKRLRAWLAAQ
jgi:hypothetical protein